MGEREVEGDGSRRRMREWAQKGNEGVGEPGWGEREWSADQGVTYTH